MTADDLICGIFGLWVALHTVRYCRWWWGLFQARRRYVTKIT